MEEESFLLLENGEPLLTQSGEKFLLMSDKVITTDIPEAEQKVIMVRQGAHLSEQMTLSNKTANRLIEENRELLKDFNQKNNQGIVIKEKFDVEDIGIRLDDSEYKLVTALCFLLHDKSETKDMASELFYMGNYFPKGEVTKFDVGGQTQKSPCLRIEEKELIKEYIGKDGYSGKHQKNVRGILLRLTEKNFWTILEQKISTKGGKEETIKIIDYLPLIRLKEICHENNKREYILHLNPIMVDQIKTKYVEIPRDLLQRLNRVDGHGNRVTIATHLLINYLLHQRINDKYDKETDSFVTDINEDNLYSKLGLDKHVKQRQPKRAIQGLENAISIINEIGLCRSVEKVIGAKGQSKYIFSLFGKKVRSFSN